MGGGEESPRGGIFANVTRIIPLYSLIYVMFLLYLRDFVGFGLFCLSPLSMHRNYKSNVKITSLFWDNTILFH